MVAHAPTTAVIARATYMRIVRRSTVVLRRHFARCNLRCKLAPRQPCLAGRDRNVSRRERPTLPLFLAVSLRAAAAQCSAPTVIAGHRVLFRASRAAIIRRRPCHAPAAGANVIRRPPSEKPMRLLLAVWLRRSLDLSQCSLPVISGVRLRVKKAARARAARGARERCLAGILR